MEKTDIIKVKYSLWGIKDEIKSKKENLGNW
ncbi:MAG: hypothetical protein K0S51_144 [Bacillales bacterium]|jgi:hypothetical protein|nr:hypothetical protein [Bacillales bacterium]